MPRKEENKPLSFSTTMRNPARIANFLQIISVYEGQILTNDVIDEIVISLIQHKLYVPMIVTRNSLWRNMLESDELFDRKTAIKIIEKSPQSHKEAGFDKGWPSRFDTWYKLPMEFGFLYYEMGQPIKVSTTGHMLIDAVREEIPNDEKIQKVFLNAMMKYQTHNPFRRNANNNVPLPLLLNVIKLLKDDPEENGAGIFVSELSFVICSPDNDAYGLYKRIKALRKKHKFTYGDEVVYEICLSMLGATSDQKKRFKMSRIIREAVDEFIRKMRITGVVSLRGNGRFLDFNMFEIDSINYILEHYTNYHTFKSKKAYFDYMGEIDSNILRISSVASDKMDNVKQNTLRLWAENNTFEVLAKELKITCGRGESENNTLKFMDKPTRFEFLTSVMLKHKFPDLIVKPNYRVDDEGLPVFTASGGLADIECFDSDSNPLVEVTLMASRNQSTNEIPAITRHLKEAIEKYPGKTVYTVFIAPHLHPDTLYMVGFSKYHVDVDIFAYDIDSFITSIKDVPCLENAIKFAYKPEIRKGDM